MEHTLRPTVGSIFYFGYLISQMPANYSLQKLPVGKALAGAVTFWGAVVMLLGAAQNFGGLAALRFLMGCAEAFLFPCCVILLTMFYTTSEQPTRTALTFSAFSSVRQVVPHCASFLLPHPLTHQPKRLETDSFAISL